jgi:hypothetical protein
VVCVPSGARSACAAFAASAGRCASAPDKLSASRRVCVWRVCPHSIAKGMAASD